ncbi:MAG TPA: tRNA 2-thiouridine(34) synthase MnmA [Desulfurivibrionaceae bacterium]|nr:tRNA 2-thiouridine(34) synthase MnmA [Desulfurivibrionaceae bacterium]
MAAGLTQLYNKKIVVAMSGGVDSSVTAALLQEAGARVTGVYMRLAASDARHHEEAARAVADHLGIPLVVVDLHEPFRREVLAYFVAAYAGGTTPNPCVVCNRTVKAGELLRQVVPQHGELLATGHYARIVPDGDGFCLRRGTDQRKDQSYFLCRLDQAVLAQLLFPLGERTKEEVYALAAARGISGRHGAESQDVCFLQGSSVVAFVAGYGGVPPQPGPILAVDGRRLGTHAGLHCYTIGQRRGLGLPDSTPYYVVALDAARNAVIVGKEEALYRSAVALADVHWLAGTPPPLPGRFLVQLRYRHPAAPARVEAAVDGARIWLDTPQRAITPGQFAVVYNGDAVVGSGVIVADEAVLG